MQSKMKIEFLEVPIRVSKKKSSIQKAYALYKTYKYHLVPACWLWYDGKVIERTLSKFHRTQSRVSMDALDDDMGRALSWKSGRHGLGPRKFRDGAADDFLQWETPKGLETLR